MKKQTKKTKMIKDIENLIAVGVTQQAIAESMKLSRQAFHQRFAIPRFTVDQEQMFYKKYRRVTNSLTNVKKSL